MVIDDQKAYVDLLGLAQVNYKGTREVIGFYTRMDKLTHKCLEENATDFTTAIGCNDLYVSDFDLIETLQTLVPDIDNTTELYYAYLDFKYPVYSYH